MMSPGGPYELKMEGSGKVRRFLSAEAKEEAEDTPAIRRIAPRNVSLIFIRFVSVAPASHRLSRARPPSQPQSVQQKSPAEAGHVSEIDSSYGMLLKSKISAVPSPLGEVQSRSSIRVTLSTPAALSPRSKAFPPPPRRESSPLPSCSMQTERFPVRDPDRRRSQPSVQVLPQPSST